MLEFAALILGGLAVRDARRRAAKMQAADQRIAATMVLEIARREEMYRRGE